MLERFINVSLPSLLHELREYQKHGNIWKLSKLPYKHSQFHPHPANKVTSQTQKAKLKKQTKPNKPQYTPPPHTPPLQRTEENTPNEAAFKWTNNIDTPKTNE